MSVLKIKISHSTKYCAIISRGDSYLPMSQYSDGNYSSSESITALFLPVMAELRRRMMMINHWTDSLWHRLRNTLSFTLTYDLLITPHQKSSKLTLKILVDWFIAAENSSINAKNKHSFILIACEYMGIKSLSTQYDSLWLCCSWFNQTLVSDLTVCCCESCDVHVTVKQTLKHTGPWDRNILFYILCYIE